MASSSGQKDLMIDSKKLRRRFIRSALVGVLFFALVAVLYTRVSDADTIDDASPLARFFFRVNETVGSALQSETRLSVEKPKPQARKKPRVNGDEGLLSPLDLKNYTLEASSGLQQIHFKIDDITSKPAVEVSTDFKCIEGWSEVIHYKGLRFSDFMDTFKLGKKSDGTYYKYVGLETPDGKYYVSIDMKSMRHPQTVLAYEMNEAPLSIENGAPLRLIIPIKYGVKSIKRIGHIYFSDERPQDFWTEQGYDWYSGL